MQFVNMKNAVYTGQTITFILTQKLTNFGSWQMVCELFANGNDGAAHVHSPIHT